jgi:hypothetical protein
MSESDYKLRYVSPSVLRLAAHGSFWKDFYETWYLSFFQNLWKEFKFN